jgi:hypothetical protein
VSSRRSFSVQKSPQFLKMLNAGCCTQRCDLSSAFGRARHHFISSSLRTAFGAADLATRRQPIAMINPPSTLHLSFMPLLLCQPCTCICLERGQKQELRHLIDRPRLPDLHGHPSRVIGMTASSCKRQVGKAQPQKRGQALCLNLVPRFRHSKYANKH